MDGMTDKELADAVVALGVVKRYPDEKEWWCYFSDEVGQHTTKTLVRDWRVAGKMTERAIEHGSFPFIGSCTTDTYQATVKRGWGASAAISHHVDESLPRAIIEACCTALGDSNE